MKRKDSNLYPILGGRRSRLIRVFETANRRFSGFTLPLTIHKSIDYLSTSALWILVCCSCFEFRSENGNLQYFIESASTICTFARSIRHRSQRNESNLQFSALRLIRCRLLLPHYKRDRLCRKDGYLFSEAANRNIKTVVIECLFIWQNKT